MMQLNPQQRQAIRYHNGHLLVLAGAGSGKTRVITEKIAHLIRHHNIQPEQIIAVTFTNKAAHEMRTRIRQTLPETSLQNLSISTFHTLGLGLLRRHSGLLGYKRGFTIFDSSDAQSLLRELLRSDNTGYSDDEIQANWAISRLKNDLLLPETALIQAQNGHEIALARLYEHYQARLKIYNAVDFDDLILQPVVLLQKHGHIRQQQTAELRHLLVDEYQDTNLCQYELVKLLLGAETKLTAVGDDDQSIYAWRGARPENLHRLTEDFPALNVIKLEQNYRSMGRILKCANQLIANNPHTLEKKLWSQLGYGDPVNIIPCGSAEEEAERVVSEILHLKFQQRCRHCDFAILYRSNHQSRLFENALRMHHLPYKVSGGTAFFDRGEIKDVLAYLRLCVNSDDDAAFLRIINTPRREIGSTTLEKLGLAAQQYGTSLFDMCLHPHIEQHLSGAALTRIRRFADWLQELRKRSEHDNAFLLSQALVDDINYYEWLLSQSKDKESAKRRQENINALLEWINNICKKQDDNLLLEELVGKLTLMDMLEKQDKQDESDAIQLITIHAAKGLEFPHVFITGCEEGLLPHHSSEQDDSVAEERRLAYVAITRAQKTLTITYALNRKKAGQLVPTEPSRFLSELPTDELHWEGQQDTTSEQRLNRGNASLQSLRDLLKNA